MIPASYIQEWSNNQWPDLRQVEQDLITPERCVIQFSGIGRENTFRGGTVINIAFLTLSEDIDLVQTQPARSHD